MSVRTQADEHLDKAKESLDTVIRELAEIVINRCPHYDFFTETSRDRMAEALAELVRIRDKVLP